MSNWSGNKARQVQLDLDGSAFELLLDGAFDWILGAQAVAVVLWQREDAQAFGDVLFQPVGQFRGAVAIAGHKIGQRGFSLGQRGRVPDRAQLGTDALADGDIRGVMEGVPDQVEMAALPFRVAEDGPTCGAQPGMVVGKRRIPPRACHAPAGFPGKADQEMIRGIISPLNARQWTSASDRATETPSTRRRSPSPMPMAESTAASRSEEEKK